MHEVRSVFIKPVNTIFETIPHSTSGSFLRTHEFENTGLPVWPETAPARLFFANTFHAPKTHLRAGSQCEAHQGKPAEELSAGGMMLPCGGKSFRKFRAHLLASDSFTLGGVK